MRKCSLLAVLLWAGFGIWSCDKKPTNPVFPKDSQFPPQPRNLAVTVDEQKISLTWNIDNPLAVKFYRIYRRDSTMATPAAIDTSIDRVYLDRNLKGDGKYFYQVSAINAGGFESKLSAAVSVTPNTFVSIIIAAGAEYVSQPQVLLKLTAPSRTALMKLSNDSLFTNAAWQRFEGTTSWILSLGDGTKTVYAKFRDSDGNEYPQLVKDSIILDTTALISEVTENTGGQIKKAGAIIHFRLLANETGGRATVNIFSGPQNILLFDNGTQGDKISGDGIYELNYTIPQDVQVIQAKIRGNFVDRVGNVATTVTAATQITIQKSPDAILMFQPVPVGSQQNALRLSWSASKDTFDFANYSIYRSQTPLPNFDPLNSTPIDRVTIREVTTYTDLNLQAGATYYYRIVVFDLAGLNSASSNEVGAKTAPNLPPSPVILNTPVLLGDGSSQAQLTWSRSTDNDFASYRIYRSNTAVVDSLSFLVTSLINQNQTVYVDENLKAATKYFYRIYIYDQAGNAAGSNIGSVTTAPNLPPVPVTLALPAPVDTTKLSLSWSQNNDPDFASYRIFRANPGAPPIDPEKQQPIAILNSNRANTTYIDQGLNRQTTYTYQVFVYDNGGLYSGSNPVPGTTK